MTQRKKWLLINISRINLMKKQKQKQKLIINLYLVLKYIKLNYPKTSHVQIVHWDCCDRLMNGLMDTVSGHVLILIYNPVSYIENNAPVMENILPQNVNVIKTTMDHVANIGMNVQLTRIVVVRENASTLVELHYHENNVIVN